MAYTAPTKFSEGDTFSATDVNKIIDNLKAIYNVHPGVKWNNATAVDHESGEWGAVLQDSDMAFVHVFRYLAFRGTGAIVDPAGIEEDIALNDEDEATFYDLESVSWLTYGMVYNIEGCTWAMEVDFY